LLVVGLAVLVLTVLSLRTGESTRQCVQDAGFVLYGNPQEEATARQLDELGELSRAVRFIPCEEPEPGELSICERARITTSPTWEFPDGSRIDRVLLRDELVELAGCTSEVEESAAIEYTDR
jgi:hypothetical protein